jgi:hypothetical protein
LEEGSVGTRIFERSGLQMLIEDHVSGRRNNFELIGFLTIMETYRHLVEEAGLMARQANRYQKLDSLHA